MFAGERNRGDKDYSKIGISSYWKFEVAIDEMLCQDIRQTKNEEVWQPRRKDVRTHNLEEKMDNKKDVEKIKSHFLDTLHKALN